MIAPFVLTVGLLMIIAPETAGFSMRHSPWRAHRLETAFRQYSTPTIQSASIREADELREMYSEIASKDPQWLQEFVIEMFDEEDEDLLAILRQAETNVLKAKANVSKKESPTTISMKTRINVSTPILISPVEKAKKEINTSVTNSTADETAVGNSVKNTTNPIVEQTNNTTKLVIEKTKFGKSPSRSEHLLERKNQAMKRDDSSQVASNQQSTAAETSISNRTKEKPSFETDRVPLTTNTSATFNSSETSAKQSEPLPSVAMKLPNTSGSTNETQNASRSGNVSTRTVVSSTANSAIEDKSEKVVVFSDSRLKKKQKVSLSKLMVLGYTTEEILSLDPDALSLIVEDTLRRPSTGVPTSWKSDKKLIQIESADDLIGEGFESNSTKTPSPERSTSKATMNATWSETELAKGGKNSRIKGRRSFFNESAPEAVAINRDQRKKPIKEVDGAAAPSSDASAKEERTRRVFTGRPAPSPPRDDPPPPKAFWPDIDTFRSLLRKEAALRLKVLGDGWSQTVKDESEWRLDLYKNWLWTLHTGVGDPLVESRSDRMRRSSRDLARAESKTKKNSSNEQRQRRQREE